MAGNARPFMHVLQEHRTGITHDLLSDALQELVAAVTQEGKAGKLVLTIGVKPMGKGDGLEVSAQIECKPPKETAGTAVYFASPDNNLVRQDPRQKAMDLREIGPAAAHKGVA